ncbi:DUF134 domain-containing protein [Desulfurococcus mucosus]|uniref:Uncharacterized protein n=1 Tax=Desulfurococcus mucosus (strain ATCC 35584 / DSM 2162 / JCM 9187 / O7/1) TaxID=765177 RepID=E8RA83_DESM0|nr:DUF134 domain-containing protein [Desulfurococcus mucosus]ADV65389.1 protein of unknown function DUF134 [Desulfurococcus mucosus DSM 2162]
MPGRCWRRRWRGVGRPPKPIHVALPPVKRVFNPEPPGVGEEYLTLPELEALRLVDLEGRSLDEAAASMNISRGYVWRLVTGARAKVARALIEGMRIIVEPGGEVEEVG